MNGEKRGMNDVGLNSVGLDNVGLDDAGLDGSALSKGHLAVVGIGPGDLDRCTLQAQEVLTQATLLYGYGAYLERLTRLPHQCFVVSDNRVEAQRASAALAQAAAGHRVAMVSGGDPGVFAMAAAICEQIEQGPQAWRALNVLIVPGVTAMLAVAAECGAPLGHDFCAISLSDNLKPWTSVLKRLEAAAAGDFVIALYNPRSKARPWQLEAAFNHLRQRLSEDTVVVFGRAAARAETRQWVTTLGQASAGGVDMATLVIIGAQATRVVPRRGHTPLVYTPRHGMP